MSDLERDADAYPARHITQPRALWEACDELAAERGLTRTQYLRGLMVADLRAAGRVVPALPRRRGRKGGVGALQG